MFCPEGTSIAGFTCSGNTFPQVAPADAAGRFSVALNVPGTFSVEVVTATGFSFVGGPSFTYTFQPGDIATCTASVGVAPLCFVVTPDFDGNGDGVDDVEQTETVSNLVDPGIAVGGSGGASTNVVTLEVSSAAGPTPVLSAASIELPPASDPPPVASGEEIQSSLVSFEVTGLETSTSVQPQTVTIEVFLPEQANRYYKYDESKPVGSRWVDYTDIVTFDPLPTANGTWRAVLTITDNARGDFDPTRGVIVDPGLFTLAPPPPPPPVEFRGFERPVTDGRNIAKSGRAVPMKWRLVGPGGVGVGPERLTSPQSVRSYRVDCTAGTATVVLATDEPASGIKYLGGGSWQYVWKTSSSWSGTCRRFELTVEGTTYTALFEFR